MPPFFNKALTVWMRCSLRSRLDESSSCLFRFSSVGPQVVVAQLPSGQVGSIRMLFPAPAMVTPSSSRCHTHSSRCALSLASTIKPQLVPCTMMGALNCISGNCMRSTVAVKGTVADRANSRDEK